MPKKGPAGKRADNTAGKGEVPAKIAAPVAPPAPRPECGSGRITLLFGFSLSCTGDDMPIADESRLIPIPDLREWYPKLNFSGRAELPTTGEPIFVTDPIYL